MLTALTSLAPLTPLHSSLANGEQRLAEFDGLAVGDVALHDFARSIGLDFVHQLHGFDDADHLAFFNAIARRDKRSRAGRWRAIEGADDRRLDDVQSGIWIGSWRGGRCKRFSAQDARRLPRGPTANLARSAIPAGCGRLRKFQPDLDVAAIQIELGNLISASGTRSVPADPSCPVVSFVPFACARRRVIQSEFDQCLGCRGEHLTSGCRHATISSMRMPNLPGQ